MQPIEYCILVAEDDSLFRYVLTRTLSRHGYRVIEAADGKEAMQRLAAYDGAVHILVTNVTMPEMDGHELGRLLKAEHPDLKVLIVSGQHENDFPAEARAHDYALLKPADPNSVLAEVQRLLRERGDTHPGKAQASELSY